MFNSVSVLYEYKIFDGVRVYCFATVICLLVYVSNERIAGDRVNDMVRILKTITLHVNLGSVMSNKPLLM